MPATSSPQLLDQVGRIMESKGIAWATVGALAVAYHGVVRASLDADALITLRGSGQDLDALVLLLRAQGWKAEARLGDEGDPLGFVVRIFDDSENQVDLIGGIRRLDAAFFERAFQDEFDGLKLRFSSPEDLVALKVFAGGPKDIEDARGVLEIQGENIDRDLLLRLCKAFGRTEENLCKGLLGL